MTMTDEDFQKVIMAIARALGEAHEPMLLVQIARAVAEPEFVTRSAIYGMMDQGLVQKIGKRYATAGLDFPTSRRKRHSQ